LRVAGRRVDDTAVALYAAMFLLATSAGVVFVLLSDFQDAYGLPTWGLGLIAAMGFLGALAVQLLLAPLADRGRARIVAVVALGAGTAGTLWLAVATELWQLAAARGLVGVGLGLFGVAARKAVIGEGGEGSGAKLGALLSASVAGFIAGPPIGAVLSGFGLAAPFVVLGVALALVAVPAQAAIGRARVATAVVRHRDLLALLRRPGIQAAVAAHMMLFGFIGVFDAVIDRYLTDLGAGNYLVAIGLLCMGLPLVVLPSRAGRWAESNGGAASLRAAIVVAVPAYAADGLWAVPAAVIVVGVIGATAEAVGFPSSQLVAVEETGASEAAIGQALLDTSGMISAGLSALVAPAIYGQLGARSLFIGYAVVAAGLGLITFQRLNARGDRTEPAAPAAAA
jgi:MFS family permease